MSRKSQHGLSYTPEYRAWQTMRLRCTEPQNAAYPDYGGRGITVCDRWLNSVQAFLEDMGTKPTPRHELDRRDNNAGYSKDNCRWVTRKVNDRNRRSNRMLTFRGETLTLAEWCERLGLKSDVVSHRLRAGWDVDRSLTESTRLRSKNGCAKPAPPRKRPPYPSDDDVRAMRRFSAEGFSYAYIARRFGIARKSVGRIVRGGRRSSVPGAEVVAA